MLSSTPLEVGEFWLCICVKLAMDTLLCAQKAMTSDLNIMYSYNMCDSVS